MASIKVLLVSLAASALAAPGLVQRSVSESAEVPLPTISASAVAVSTIDDAPKPTLEPITPPDSDQDDIEILNPGKKVSLFYKSRPVSSKRAEAEDVTLAELDFTFQ